MASTGSSSSVSTPDARPLAVPVVVGLTGLDRTPEADAVVEEVRTALATRADTSDWRIVVARRSPGDAEHARAGGGRVAGAIVEAGYTLQPSDALSAPYHGHAGRARAIHAVLREAHAGEAGACVVVDTRATADVARWMGGFVDALVTGGLDLVAPLYGRHPFTGALVGGIVRPMFRALYGARLHYPIGAHVGCSSRLMDAVLADPVWDSDIGQIGIDLWLSSFAASSGFQVGEAAVPAPPADDRPRLDLSTTLAQVVGFLFADMERGVRVWQRVRGSKLVPRFGRALTLPEAPDVDPSAIAESFRLAHRDLQDVWAEVLPPLAVLQWRRLAAAPLETFRVDDALWARTLYDFAMGHRLRVIARDHLLRSLTPMYLAWLASFMLEMRFVPVEAAEARLERLCLAFEAEKPYLVSQWRWPARFKPVKTRR